MATATLQVFIGDSITSDGLEFILPLLSEASNHPEAFLEFLSAKVSFICPEFRMISNSPAHEVALLTAQATRTQY